MIDSGNSQSSLTSKPPQFDHVHVSPKVTYLTNVTYESKLALETGYNDKNEWLEWILYTAMTTGKGDCVACAKARPLLGTVPFRLTNSRDREGLQCTIRLFKSHSAPGQSKTLSFLFPAVKRLF